MASLPLIDQAVAALGAGAVRRRRPSTPRRRAGEMRRLFDYLLRLGDDA